MTAGRVARLMGRLFFVTGFIVAILGLTRHDRFLTNASLALLVTAIAATGFALYRHAKDARSAPSSED
jgi:hypothetical protein